MSFKPVIKKTIKLKVGDTAPEINDTLTVDGVALDVSGGTITFIYLDAEDIEFTAVTIAGSIVDAVTGKVKVQVDTAMTTTGGTRRLLANWRITGLPGGDIYYPQGGWYEILIYP